MKKNLKIFGVGAVLPSLAVVAVSCVASAEITALIAASLFSISGGVHCGRETVLVDTEKELNSDRKTIEGLEYSLRSLRAKYGRLKSDIREMVK